MTSYMEHPSPLGRLVLAATEHGLCGVYFEEHKYFSGVRDWHRDPGQQWVARAATQLDEYFAGDRTDFDIPLDLNGTGFQRSVWDALCTLPFGSTASYRAIAERVARPSAIRAAGTAIGRNPVSIIVPCHRVVGVAGALSGYAGGVERKRFLLTLEGHGSEQAGKGGQV